MFEKFFIRIRPVSRYLLAGWIMVIIVVSSTPSIPTLNIHTANAVIRLDYLIHFCEYGVLALMAFLSSTGKRFNMNYRKFALVTLGLITFAFLDELHQKFVPGRAFNIKDIFSNMSGVLVALIFCAVIFRKIADKTENVD